MPCALSLLQRMRAITAGGIHEHHVHTEARTSKLGRCTPAEATPVELRAERRALASYVFGYSLYQVCELQRPASENRTEGANSESASESESRAP